MFSQVSYNVIIERFKAYADGHYLIKRFSHGQIDVADIMKDAEYAWMHVVPVSMNPATGTRSFSFDVIFADMPRDKEDKTEYQRESLSDCIRLAEDLLAEIQNGYTIFGRDVELEQGATITPFMEEYTHVLTGVTLSLTMTFSWDWNACEIPADWSAGGSGSGGTGGGGASLVLKTNGTPNVVQTILDLVDGTGIDIIDLGDGRVQFTNTGGGGGAVSWGAIVGTLSNQTDLQNALNLKADISSLGAVALSNDYNDLDNLPTIPPAQVNSDWNAVSGVEEILNKPTIPTATSDLTNDSGFITIGDVPPQVQSDWNQTDNTQVDYIQNKPTLPATIGDMTKAVYDTDDDGIVDFAEALKTEVRNSTGATLRKGYIVRLSGSTGNLPNAVLAQGNNDANSAQTFGVVYADIPNNSDGFVITLGQISTLDTRTTATHPFTTDTLQDGDVLYLSPTIAGYVTRVKPSAPQHMVYVGMVVRTSPTNGTIQYRIQNGYELHELHDVQLPSPSNNDVLYYDGTTSLWKSKALTKSDVGLGNVDNTSDANKPISTATQTALNAKVTANSAITGATKTKITYDSKGLVTAGADIVASDISDSTSVGQNLVKLTNPSAIRYLRINADNSVSSISASQLATDLSIVATQTAILATAFTNVGTGFESVTDLSFAVTANKTYKWRVILSFTATATTTFSVTAPASPTFNTYRFIASNAATTITIFNGTTYDAGTNSAMSSNGVVSGEGMIRPTANGTFSIRVRCATAGLLSLRAGSTLEYQEVL